MDLQTKIFESVEKLDKKGLSNFGQIHARNLLEDGFHESVVLTVQAKKAIEYLKAFALECDYQTRKDLMEQYNSKADIFGANLSLSSSGDRLDYEADPIYYELKTKLKEREDLLKLAFKSSDSIYDAMGAEVMKVPIKTHSKETLKVKL